MSNPNEQYTVDLLTGFDPSWRQGIDEAESQRRKNPRPSDWFHQGGGTYVSFRKLAPEDKTNVVRYDYYNQEDAVYALTRVDCIQSKRGRLLSEAEKTDLPGLVDLKVDISKQMEAASLRIAEKFKDFRFKLEP